MARTSTLLGALSLGFCLFGGVASAGEPVDKGVDGNGYVNVEMEVDHPVALVNDYLANPTRAMELSPDVLDASSVPHGKCQKVSVKARGMLSPMHYVVLRCPTGVGYTEQLLESGDFTAHNVEWTLHETASGGTVIKIKARTRLNFPVPSSTLAKVAGQSLKSSLKGLDKDLDKQVADASED